MAAEVERAAAAYRRFTEPVAHGGNAETLMASSRDGGAASLRGLGFPGIVLGGSGDVPAFVEGRLLAPLAAYDERRGTGLLHTVETCVRCDRLRLAGTGAGS
ncbi:hypothetical protein [Streptomyces acidicola]|uniref:Uncharacterized protein n=1 Tax=Streptomyces acidicola TaxID=2596892 RepID=A0A5N8WZ20_9ACTN|nr:hypothetical protein [Streptomyces acidicola]MPY52322.1 hypothetical protein [Streptomyces acidicola]